jgi:hypothetical protein
MLSEGSICIPNAGIYRQPCGSSDATVNIDSAQEDSGIDKSPVGLDGFRVRAKALAVSN